MSDNNKSHSQSYADAGVDVTSGYETIKKIRPMVESTFIPGVLGSIGGFGGMFAPDLTGMTQPVLVSGADGVGTKLKLAFSMEKHDTIGIDAVAMCVNDIICTGARPLFFLDYLAVGKLLPQMASEIVHGVAEGCKMAGCALIGGETAEMPGFYSDGEYDVAGFAIGIVDKSKIVDGSKMQEGDTIIALASNGLHSNGFSLVRKVLGDDKASLAEPFMGRPIGQTLLEPTRIYVKSILSLLEKVEVKGLCNITGGGWYENIPRMLKDGLSAQIRQDALPVPPIFDHIAKAGSIPMRDMYNTFNMGAGMFVVVSPSDAERALSVLREAGETAAIAGQCVAGSKGLEII